jgi:hypothetical protein
VSHFGAPGHVVLSSLQVHGTNVSDSEKTRPEEPVKPKPRTLQKEVVAIDPKKIFRVTINEITPRPFAAFDSPGGFELAGCANERRMLDHIVGYKISPFFGTRCAAARRTRATVALRRGRARVNSGFFRRNTGPSAMLDAGRRRSSSKLFKHKARTSGGTGKPRTKWSPPSARKWQVASVAQKKLTTSKLQRLPTIGCYGGTQCSLKAL